MKHTVHFVCRGNVYRSRLAEAIMRKIGGAHIVASSSGIETWRMNLIEPTHIRPDLLFVCDELGLSEYLTPERTQTTNELLENADLIIFMDHDVYRDALQKFTFNTDKAEVWHVAGILESAEHQGLNPRTHRNQRLIFRKTARNVQRLCEDLANDVNHVSWTDIVDDTNTPRGFSLPLSWACRKALLWRGVHVVLTTPEDRYVVEKRSSTIFFSPGMLDITLGGAVDSGEAVEAAAVRETKEELGISIHLNELKLLEVRKWNAYHPRYKTNTNVLLTTYHVKLRANNPLIVPQRKEVAAVRLLSYRQISRLIRRKSIRHFGRLKTSYEYLKAIVAETRAVE